MSRSLSLAIILSFVALSGAQAEPAPAGQTQIAPGAAAAQAQIGAPARVPAPVNFSEAQQIALQAYPGKVLDSRTGQSEKQKWFEFDIRTNAGMMAYLKVDQGTGNIINVTYRNVKDMNTLPPPKFPEAEIRKIALDYVEKNSGVSSALGPAEVTSIKYALHKNRPSYIVQAQKHMRRFTLYIDPYTGKITDSQGRN